MARTWFITGANKGFGRVFATAALQRGDQVVATSRTLAALDDLVAAHGNAVLPVALDVTHRAGVVEAIAEAVATFGRIDVVVNNAGYGLFGMVEEISEQALRDQIEVNLFGSFHVIQAVLPVLRGQRGGHIVQISTVGGIAAFPDLGGYHASKWAVEGLCESLAQEVAGLGIKVTLVEPGIYATDWAGSSAVRAQPLAAYEAVHAARALEIQQMPEDWVGDPSGVGAAILTLVDAPDPPLRVFFGKLPVALVPALYAKRLQVWKEWEPLSLQAHGRPVG